jgi:hypothetical protein
LSWPFPIGYKACGTESSARQSSSESTAFADCENKIAQALYTDQERQALLSRPTGLLKWFAENGIALGALLAGIVGLLSFVGTRAAALRQERYTQIYEALKRLADPDSVLRCTATGLLLRLAVEKRTLNKTLLIPQFINLGFSRRRFAMIFDQLNLALLLECDLDVLATIERTIALMLDAAYSSSRVFYGMLASRVAKVESCLNDDRLIDAVAIAVSTAGDVADASNRDALFKTLASRTGVSTERLNTLVLNQQHRYAGMIQICNALDPKDRLALRATAYASLDSFRVRIAAFERIKGYTPIRQLPA